DDRARGHCAGARGLRSVEDPHRDDRIPLRTGRLRRRDRRGLSHPRVLRERPRSSLRALLPRRAGQGRTRGARDGGRGDRPREIGEVVSPKFQEHLRSVSGVFIPNRSFTSYVDLDAIEDDFRIPIFGSRNLLRTEEREFEKSYYWILEKAKLPTPEKFEQARDIDGLAIVKLPHKVKKLERGFFTAASYPEFREKSQALLKQGVISEKDLKDARIERYIIGPIFNFDFFYSPIEDDGEKLELLGIDWRFERSLDGHVRLPAEQQRTLNDAQRIPEYVVVGHNAATLRESSLND